MKALQWLRGWVPEQAVQNEFENTVKYIELTKSCAACIQSQQKCSHPAPTLKEKFNELKRKRILKPAIINLTTHFVALFSGMSQLLPFFVQIFKTYGSPISPGWTTVLMGICGIIGNISIAIAVKFIGKRKIFLTAVIGICCCQLLLGAFGFYYLPLGTKSFHQDKTSNNSENSNHETYVPFILFVILRLCSVGAMTIPQIMHGELFPFKLRSLAVGCITAFNNIFTFSANKLFYNIEDLLTLPGALILYGIIGIVG